MKNRQACFAIVTGLFLLAQTACSVMSPANLLQSRAECLKTGDDIKQKLVACDAAIRSRQYTGSRLSDLYFMKGIHQQAAGRHTAAIRSFRQALKQNPKDPKVYYYLSMSQLRLGHIAAGQLSFETAHRLN